MQCPHCHVSADAFADEASWRAHVQYCLADQRRRRLAAAWAAQPAPQTPRSVAALLRRMRQRGYSRRWYAANREYVKQTNRDYRATHPDIIRAQKARYEARHRDAIRLRNAVRRQDHPRPRQRPTAAQNERRRIRYATDPDYRARKLTQARVQRVTHREQRNARERRAYAAHPEVERARKRRQRERDPHAWGVRQRTRARRSYDTRHGEQYARLATLVAQGVPWDEIAATLGYSSPSRAKCAYTHYQRTRGDQNAGQGDH
jgi:hypothetical protein